MVTLNSVDSALQPGNQFPGETLQFSSDDEAQLLRSVRAARAILRSIILAICAQEDGSILFDDNTGAERWSGASSEVCNRLRAVRSVLMERGQSPKNVDWVTSLTLAEALDAALWFGFSCSDQEKLNNDEVVIAAQVIVDSLDSMLNEYTNAATKPPASVSVTDHIH